MKRNCARDNNCQRTDWRVTTERRPQIFIFRTSRVEVTYKPLFISIKQLKLFFCRSHILRLQSSIDSYQVTFTKTFNLFKLETIEKKEGVYQIPRWCVFWQARGTARTQNRLKFSYGNPVTFIDGSQGVDSQGVVHQSSDWGSHQGIRLISSDISFS